MLSEYDVYAKLFLTHKYIEYSKELTSYYVM